MTDDQPSSDPTRPVEDLGDEGRDPGARPSAPTEALPQDVTRSIPDWRSPGYPYGSQAPTPYPAPPAPWEFPQAPPHENPPPPQTQPTAYPAPPAHPSGAADDQASRPPIQAAYGPPGHDQSSYGQAAYGQPTYGQAPPPPSALPQQWIPPQGYAGTQPAYPQTNTSALVLLIVSGMMTLSCYFTVVGIAPLILAIVAMTKQNTDWAGSRRLSKIGWIVLGVLFGLCVLGFIAFVAMAVMSDTSSSSYN